MNEFAIGLLLAFICVGVHYEGLSVATALIRRASKAHRLRVVIGLIAAIFAHIIEVVIFAVGWSMLEMSGLAELNIENPTFTDNVYFSFVTYSSLGYGDIVPLGPARVIAGLEALVGLVLIAWTASFTYFEMTMYWGDSSRHSIRRPGSRDPRFDSPEVPDNDPIE